MPRLGYCMPCGETRKDTDATQMVGDDPMCDMHARMLGDGMLTKLPEPVPVAVLPVAEPAPAASAAVEVDDERRICKRGCGGSPHRGRCRGNQPLPALEKYRIPYRVAPRPETPVQPVVRCEVACSDGDEDLDIRKVRAMDRLVAEEIDLDAVPKTAMSTRMPIGRAGELWLKFQALAPGKALKVACRDAVHVGTTIRNLQEKAAAAGLAVGSKRSPNELWCWKEKVEGR